MRLFEHFAMGNSSQDSERAFHPEHPDPVYLRFGHWPADERSRNHVTGDKEFGVSVYDLDKHGEPMDPDHDLARGVHEHSVSCYDEGEDGKEEVVCGHKEGEYEEGGDYGNDTYDEMHSRVHRAEQARRRGGFTQDLPHLVKGDFVGWGHDDEPLINNVRRVGDWIDHRHLFVPGAEKHHLARDEDDEDYEEPEEPPTHHTAALPTWRDPNRVRLNPDKQRQHDIALHEHLIQHHPEILQQPPGLHDAMHRAAHTDAGQGYGAAGYGQPSLLGLDHPHHPLIDPSVPKTQRLSARERPQRWQPEPPPEGLHSAFRGLHLGGDTRGEHVPDPEGRGIGSMREVSADHSDQGILDRMQRHHEWKNRGWTGLENIPESQKEPWKMYGSHWTKDSDLAHQFAFDTTHGQYRGGRFNEKKPTNGVVLEAQSRKPFDADALGSQYGESETKWPGRSNIERVIAHVHRYDPEEHGPFNQARAAGKTYVRSFEIPAEHIQRYAAKDVDDIMNLLGPGVPKAKEPDPQADADRDERIRKHQEWQATRKGYSPGDDLSDWQGYPHAEWVPIGVAQHFRDHTGNQHSGSQQVVDAIAGQLKAGRGMTDPLMLLHHNEEHRALLGEGNHRLVAAEKAGWTHVPMRVVRMYDGEAERGKGQVIPHAWRGTLQGRTPELARPSEVLSPGAMGSRRQATYSGEREEGGSERGRPGLDQSRGRIGRALSRLRRLRADSGSPGEGDLRPLTWHPKALKEYKRLDKPAKKAVDTTLEGLQRNDPNLQTHTLSGALKGWYSTKASRGHRIVHQRSDDGGIYIGGVSLHEYPNQRFSAREDDLPKETALASMPRHADPNAAQPYHALPRLTLAEAAYRTVTEADGSNYDGVMVAFVPPEWMAEALVLDQGTEDASNLHVTLCYLGNQSEYTSRQLRTLPEVVAGWAQDQKPVTARTQGAGTFLPADEDGKHVVWASVDIPEGHRLHTSLVDHLRATGYAPHEDHSWTPHITLSYYNHAQRFLPKITSQEWEIEEVWVCIGGQWQSLPLGR